MLQVKGNQPKLRAALAAPHEARATCAATHTHCERRSGQLNTWQTTFYPCADSPLRAAWEGLAGFVVVVKTVSGPQATHTHTRYYLTSLAERPVAGLAAGIRGHWGIENRLHRARDGEFRQDTNGIRHRKAAANVAIFNTLALNYLLTNVDASLRYAQLHFAQNFKTTITHQRI